MAMMNEYATKIIMKNIVDTEVALSATPAMSATLPVTNLQTQERDYVARTTSTAPQAIKGNLTYSRSSDTDGIALIGDYSSNATIRIRLYSEINQGGTVVFDTGEQEVQKSLGWGDFIWAVDHAWGGGSVFEANSSNIFYFVFFDDPRYYTGGGKYKSFQIDLDDAHPAGYMQFRRLYLGTVLSTRCNPTYGYSFGLKDDTVQKRDDAGGLHSTTVQQYRTVKYTLEFMSEDERNLFFRNYRWCGKTRDVFLCMLTEDFSKPENFNQQKFFDHAMPCKFVNDFIGTYPYFGEWQHDFEFEEV
jgi:hypothetical protein